MKTNKMSSSVPDSASGVSELIGAILMITVVIAAVAIIGIFLLSQQTPQEVPNINFMTGTNAAGTTLYLYHNGGDSLEKGQFAVVIDNQAPRTDFSISDGSNEWAVGKNLVLGITSPPQTVSIIYNAGDTAPVLLRSASSSVATLQNNINPSGTPVISSGGGEGFINASDPQVVVNFILGNTSLIGDAINQSPSTVGPVIANVVGTNSITFFREKDTTIPQNTYFTFNVTRPGSTLLTEESSPSPIPLSVRDVVTVTQAANGNGQFKIFGIGDQLWEFSATKVTISIHRADGSWYNEPTSGQPTNLLHSWVTGYQDMGSTLSLVSVPSGQAPATGLVINSSVKINLATNTPVTITNIRPVGIGLFVLEADPSDANAVYFVGQAGSVVY